VGASTISRHTYTVDPVGNRSQVQEVLLAPSPGPSTTTPGWEFASNAENWTSTAGTSSTLSWIAGDGSPSGGSLEAKIAGKNKSATNVWSLQRTWEQLGVPAGATVTGVRLASIRQRTSDWSTPGATNTWNVELHNSSGATQATLLPTQTETGAEASWSADLSGTTQTVPTTLQASGSTVRLAISAAMATGNNNAAQVGFRWDHVALAITYQPAPPSPVTQTTSYDYDKLSRLTGVTAPEGPTSYGYDPVGNRLTMTRNGTPTAYQYDRADRITAAGSTSYTLNANGNLVGRGSDTFTYDQANRLKTATIGGASSTYAYDGDGKRASKTVGGMTTGFVYDINQSLPVVLDDGARKYVWGLGLAYAVNGSSIEVYHTDGLGSVRAITDAAGSVTQTYRTDEFGVPLQTQGTSTNPFQYTGEQRDGESGFVYLRARMYDPQIGRFTQRDPWAGKVEMPSSLQRFAYVGNNPTTWTDPSGLVTGGLCLSGIIGVGAYVTGTACIVIASDGDIGVTVSTGGGGSTGIVSGVSAGIQGTTAEKVSDLNGWSAAAGGGSARLGPGLGVEASVGRNPADEIITSGIFLVGVGANFTPPSFPGVEFHGGFSHTWAWDNIIGRLRMLTGFQEPARSQMQLLTGSQEPARSQMSRQKK
jgi:RHS repeat-associated protein